MVKLFLTAALVASTHAVGTVTTLPADVLARVDASVDPCDDFFTHACGTWYKNTPILPTQSGASMIQMLINKGNAVVGDILKANKPKLGEFYNSCLDTATLTALGVTPIEDDLHQIQAAATTADLVALSAQLSKRGVPAFTSIGVDMDVGNPVANALYAQQGSLTLDPSLYVNPQAWAYFQPAYKRYVTTVLKLAGQSDAEAKAAADTIGTFELNLAGVHLTKAQLRDAQASNYNPMTFAEAAATYPLTIGSLLNEYGLDTGAGWSGLGNKIILNDLAYFDNAEGFLAAQSKATLATVLHYRVIHSNAQHLTPVMKTAYWQLFGQILQGARVEPSREQFCVDAAIATVGDILGQYFLDATFNNATAAFAEKMVAQIEKAFKDGLDQATWLDAQTLSNAKTKLSKFSHLIGGSKDLQMYSTVQFDAKAFLTNRQQIDNINSDYDLSFVGAPARKNHIPFPPSTVNAFYYPYYNEIVFLAGILQAPFFDGSFDPAQNFGAIGMVIGHEITHGFDSMGRHFDGDGFQTEWWTPEATTAFTQKAQCIIDQYSNFTVTSEVTGKVLGTHDGRLTLPESIADNGGLKASFRAYKEYIKTAKSIYTQDAGERLFFLAFAQKDCGKYSDAYYINHLKTDIHPLGKWRTWGALQNNDDFARVFKCPVGSHMNPVKKCHLWE
ncbi:Aste57867_1679 [Aphanomyces stellatus]|uniref:Aste57867_1679 protein n=1 Tax=Aphanomyces stellatus TaxID=120398 RepID=A0A485K5V8_9STRA|nr:hypothetical protein As57867_001677 [Aphanomyces stellatus]VFT78890.1 Aste57867_1679 [Aphanomyces stellatus]